MVFSAFNVLRKQPTGEAILYNSKVGSIIVLSQKMVQKYENGFLPPELAELGFLIEEGMDEAGELFAIRRRTIANTDTFRVTIAPTLACNARCCYCFEQGHHHNTMSDDTVAQTIKFLQQESQGKNLGIHWFGGEPLTCPDIIERITKGVKSTIGDKHFSALITTNGYLATPDIVEKFADWSIVSVQITIDGTRHEYEKRKKYLDDADHYNIVLDNIENILSHGIRVVARMNLDRNNYEDIQELIPELVQRFRKYRKFSYYVYPILGRKGQANLIDAKEIGEMMSRLYRLLYQDMDHATYAKLALNPRPIHYGARRSNLFTIDPDGNLSKCEHNIGKSEHSVGNVFDGIIKNDEYRQWVTASVSENCRNCEILPVCQGGCPANTNTNIGRCPPTKETLPYLLDVAYQLYLERR